MNTIAKVTMMSPVATGTLLGVAGAYNVAPDLATLTMHYFNLSDAALPYDVVDAWSRGLNLFWSVVVTLIGSALAAYLPASPSVPASSQTSPDPQPEPLKET